MTETATPTLTDSNGDRLVPDAWYVDAQNDLYQFYAGPKWTGWRDTTGVPAGLDRVHGPFLPAKDPKWLVVEIDCTIRFEQTYDLVALFRNATEQMKKDYARDTEAMQESEEYERPITYLVDQIAEDMDGMGLTGRKGFGTPRTDFDEWPDRPRVRHDVGSLASLYDDWSEVHFEALRKLVPWLDEWHTQREDGERDNLSREPGPNDIAFDFDPDRTKDLDGDWT